MAGSLPFSEEEKGIVRDLLGSSTSMDWKSDLEDDSQAERATGDWTAHEPQAARAKPKAKSKAATGQSRAKASPRARSPAR
mmetsp:Transcript_162568/g.288052  ORF Transcript_162568/g.288052 Transcript_162568/m.288052 type:complete len:81 (+) Transcript_162568:3-245(+)